MKITNLIKKIMMIKMAIHETLSSKINSPNKEITISPLRMVKDKYVLCYFDAYLPNNVTLRNLKLVKSKNNPLEYFISTPHKKNSDGKYYPEYWITNKFLYKKLQKLATTSFISTLQNH